MRKSSQQKYDVTKKKYTELIKAMKRAEGKLEPALAPLPKTSSYYTWMG